MLNNIKFFILGIIAAILALALELILTLAFPEEIVTQEYFKKFTWLVLGIAFIEESLKISFVVKGIEKTKSKNIIANSLFLGLGFGTTEIFFKNFFSQNTFSIGILSAFFIHIITALIIGFFLSRKETLSRKTFLKIISINIIIHLGYNLSVIYFF